MSNTSQSPTDDPENIDWSNEDHQEEDLTDRDLTGAILQGTDLRGATLDGTNLSNATLKDADLRGVTMDGVSLVDADLSGARLRAATIMDSRCMDAEFDEASMRGVRFHNTNCTQATFNEVLAQHSTFENTQLLDAKAKNAAFSEATFVDSDLRDIEFRKSNLSNARIEDTDGEEADLRRSNLSNAECIDSTFTLAEFPKATLNHATLTDSEFDAADLTGARLKSTIVEGCSAQNAKFHGANLNGAEFSDAKLQYASFRPEDTVTSFEDGLLERADVRGADFTDTAMYQTILTNIRLNDRTHFDGKGGSRCIYETGGDENSGITPEESGVKKYEAAANCYRHLESVYSANDLSSEERQFHIRKKEADRLNPDFSGFQWLSLSLSKWLTGYGERFSHLLVWWLAIPSVFAFLYLFTGVPVDGGTCGVLVQATPCDQPLTMTYEAVVLSFSTFVTLDAGSASLTNWTAALRIIEALFGALLLALFVFILGRRTER
jgi:uncharacterized protein YjbI with pentapeptide repeats